MSQKNGNGSSHFEFDENDLARLPRKAADEGREPKLLAGRMGTRMYSVAAIVEQVVTRFNDEHGEESTAYREARTRTERLRLLRDTVDYVLAVESIQISNEQRAELMRRAYSELYGYGPLDRLFQDESITTITLEGADKAAVRHEHGELSSMDPIFEDYQHFLQIMRRLANHAGAELSIDQPFIEAGLIVDGRPVAVNLAGPPVAMQIAADIRVHPRHLPSLDDLVASDFLTSEARIVLEALAKSPHGFVIVGDTESGKTTLLSVLAHQLLHPERAIAVERAGELRLPENMQRLRTVWPFGEQEGVSFGAQIGAALSRQPECILLDEVRADEPQAIAPLLQEGEGPRQIWVFRGPSDAKRLQSALGMLARRAEMGQSEALVQALYRRLPFMVIVKRSGGRIELRSIAEWQFPPGQEYPNYAALMEKGWRGVALTGKRPSHRLDLPDDFWG